MTLSDQQTERYSRQIIVPGIGGKQRRLLSASVAILSAGEAARTAAVYLAAGGVGQLRLAADDRGARLFSDGLREVNADCVVRGEPGTPEGLRRCVAGTAAVLSDDDAVTETANALCMAEGIPLLATWGESSMTHTAVFAGHRQDTACWNCLPAKETGTGTGGERDTIADALAGTILATETMKWILGLGAGPAGLRLTYDWQRGEVTRSALAKNPNCNVCGSPRAVRSQRP